MKLIIENVSKVYSGSVWGLRDFSLEIDSGVLGLLGPNGAGKSTLMRIIATITKPTKGRIIWNGQDIKKHPNGLREILGYLPQDFNVYPNPTTEQFTINTSGVYNTSVKMIDVLGNVVMQEMIAGNSKTMDVKKFKNGIYFLTVSAEGVKPVTLRVLIP